MTNMERAIQIRDSILKIAPSAYLESVDGNEWAAAMLCAEQFFNLQGSENQLLKLWNQNRSVVYISYALGMSQLETVRLLQENKVPVFTGRDLMDVEYVLGCIKMHSCYIYDIHAVKRIMLAASIGSYMPVTEYAGEVTPEERDVWDTMIQDGYSIPDIALHSGREVKQVIAQLLPKEDTELLSSVASKWVKGRSTSFISLILNVSIGDVNEAIAKLKYPTDFGTIDMNLFLLNRYKEGKCPAFIVRKTLPEADEKRFVTALLSRGASDKCVSTALGISDNMLRYVVSNMNVLTRSESIHRAIKGTGDAYGVFEELGVCFDEYTELEGNNEL